MKAEKNKNTQRLVSLDALRGFDMFFIMGGDALFLSLCSLLPFPILKGWAPQMQHAAWEGFTFYDLIFPLFLFIAGVSFPLSLAKQRSEGKSDLQISLKILRRGGLLILLGMIYNGLLQLDFDSLRCASVLGRIGMAWMLAALLFLWCRRKTIVLLSVGILLGYWALLAGVDAPDAVGASSFSMEGSIVGYVDRLLLPGVLYNGIHDPEGILSTFPAVVTALIGMFVGEYVGGTNSKGSWKKIFVLMVAGIVLLLIGWIWSDYFPCIKNLWTSSFVSLAGGVSILLFTIFYLIIDVIGCQRWALFFRVIGVNALTIYLLQPFVDFHHLNKSIFGGCPLVFVH
jgi:predicted acyltransferase